MCVCECVCVFVVCARARVCMPRTTVTRIQLRNLSGEQFLFAGGEALPELLHYFCFHTLQLRLHYMQAIFLDDITRFQSCQLPPCVASPYLGLVWGLGFRV